MRFFLHLISIIVLTVAVTGSAESLKEKQEREKAWKNLDSEKAMFKRMCGGELKMDINWDSFKDKWEGNHKPGSAVAYCGNVMSAAAHVCETSKDAKDTVNKKLTKVVCSYKEGVTTKDFPKTGMKFDGTTLNVSYDWKTGNIGDGAKEFLMENL